MTSFLIRKKEIKYVKLILISPWLGQIIDFFHIITLPLIIIKFVNFPKSINNFNTKTNLENFFEKEFIKNITEPKAFFDYVIYITEKLNDFKTFPMFIPIGSLRMKKYSLNSDCYDINPVCKDSFSCKFLNFYLKKSIVVLFTWKN